MTREVSMIESPASRALGALPLAPPPPRPCLLRSLRSAAGARPRPPRRLRRLPPCRALSVLWGRVGGAGGRGGAAPQCSRLAPPPLLLDTSALPLPAVGRSWGGRSRWCCAPMLPPRSPPPSLDRPAFLLSAKTPPSGGMIPPAGS